MKNLKNISYGAVGVLSLGGLLLGSTTLNGVFVGAMSALGAGLILLKLKDRFPRLFRFIVRHNMLSDLVLSLLMVLVIGTGTITGIIAATSASLFISAGLSYFGTLVQGQEVG